MARTRCAFAERRIRGDAARHFGVQREGPPVRVVLVPHAGNDSFGEEWGRSAATAVTPGWRF